MKPMMISVEKAYRLGMLNQRMRAANAEAQRLQEEAQDSAVEFQAICNAEGITAEHVVVTDPGRPFPVGAIVTKDGQPVLLPDPPPPVDAAPALPPAAAEPTVIVEDAPTAPPAPADDKAVAS